MFEVVTAGAVAGLISAPHCALMCGPIGVHASRCGSRGMGHYQLARAIGYAGLGIGAGLIGEPLIAALWSSSAALLLSLGLAVVMLLAAVRIWPTTSAENNVSPRAANAEAQRLVPLRPRKSLFTRILRRLPKSPAMVGACSALLPCGALWTGVALAVATGSPTSGAVLMLSFAATSGIGVWASSRLLGRTSGLALSARPMRARIVAGVLALGAVILVWRPLAMQDAFRNLHADSAEDGATTRSCPLHPGGMP